MARVLEVMLYGNVIGLLEEDDNHQYFFQYNPEFLETLDEPSKVSISPVLMPSNKTKVYQNKDPRNETWNGLPGVIADSLPDKFGSAVIKQYFDNKYGYQVELSAFQKLLYIGNRGMGALEFHPLEKVQEDYLTMPLEISELVKASRKVIKGDLNVKSAEIMRVSASAGGARPKALIGWNPKTNEVISGIIDKLPEGFERWIIKFDAVEGEKPGPFGMLEYAYSLMAVDAGIKMNPLHVLKEHGRTHFLTKRFDRTQNDEKIHMVSLCGLLEQDFNVPGSSSYEDLVLTAKKLKVPQKDFEEIIRRMVFNVVLRNQDDHSKNFSFLMDKNYQWSISPAYDMTYAHGKGYTLNHQTTINGKLTDITLKDMEKVSVLAGLEHQKFMSLIKDVTHVAKNCMSYFEKAGLMNAKHPEWKELLDYIKKDLIIFSSTEKKLKIKP
jgi:serine/threonine-protein kinase HipA